MSKSIERSKIESFTQNKATQNKTKHKNPPDRIKQKLTKYFYKSIFPLMRKQKQTELLKRFSHSYGGELQKKRRGRQYGRPIDTRTTMHMVLRSSKAKGEWSFKRHDKKLRSIVDKFAKKYGIKILALANVGNHLHFHMKITNRQTYKPFIRAITASIVTAVTGASRWKKLRQKFWDYRPFTRVVVSLKAFMNLKKYIIVNEFEGAGCDRLTARLFAAMESG